MQSSSQPGAPATRTGTVAIVIQKVQEAPEFGGGTAWALLEALSDEHEIAILEEALTIGEDDALRIVHRLREKTQQEDEEFGDYVEGLLIQPALKAEIKDHAISWMKSRMKIDEYREKEREATRVIAMYAFKIFLEDPTKTDFFLASSNAKVHIKVFRMSDEAAEEGSKAA